MNYGLYVSASGVLTNMHRQDVLANNLANVDTVAFKRDIATFSQRDPESVEEGLTQSFGNALLDKLGGGAYVGPTQMDMKAGAARATGGDLDLLLEQSDTYFVVETPADQRTGDTPAVRLTRDGRFAVNSAGYLVTATGGQRVLDSSGAPVSVPLDAKVKFDTVGRLRTGNNEVVGQIGVTRVPDGAALRKTGAGMYTWGERDPRKTVENVAVKPGFVESSGVDPIKELVGMMETTSAITNNTNMIRYYDRMMDRAINSLGRVG